MHPFLLASATQLADLIRRGEATSTEVVEAHIAQIQRVDGALHAVVADRFAAARTEARAADERKARDGDALPPLHGVPCSIKESFALVGMPNSAGLFSRRHHRSVKDAPTVAKLRAAGAIPLGVTNISELCMWMESSNVVYGRTNNPYDVKRIVGGSSGGEAAIVAAGGAPFGLGSDIGGSIRMPAFFNGIFGHKPTAFTVSNEGQFPVSHGAALGYLGVGPMVRRAEDLFPLLSILAEPGKLRGTPRDVSLRGLDVLVVEGNHSLRVSDDLVAAQHRCAEALARKGARIRVTHFPRLSRSLEIWSAMMATAGGPSFASLMGEGPEVPWLGELGRWLVGRSRHTLPAIGLAGLEKLQKLVPGRLESAIEQGRLLRRELVEAIGDHGIMLYPPYPETAPRHHEPLFPPFQFTYTAVINAMEMPATQVPLGLDRRGLPLGVQVVSVHGNDHVCIAVAEELERAFGGWVPPPLASGGDVR